jgi:hypothetical protein
MESSAEPRDEERARRSTRGTQEAINECEIDLPEREKRERAT